MRNWEAEVLILFEFFVITRVARVSPFPSERPIIP